MKNKHLQFWEENCSIDQFKSWCNKEVGWKNSVLRIIKASKSKSVLDVGCGLAHMGEKIRNLDSTIDYVGTEITMKFVEHNNKNNFKCIFNNLEKLPFDDNTFDTTICLDVLNHQLDYENKILEMLRVTNKHLIISFFKSWEKEDTIIYKHDNLIYHHFELNSFKQFLEKNNLNYNFFITNLKVNPKILVISK